jgi:hypothetical protein
MLTGLKGLLLGAIGLAAAMALGGLALAQEPTPTAAPIAACPADVTLTVSPPAASAPTTVTVALSQEVNIKPATAGDPTSFHLHYFVDTDPVAAGQAIPTGNPKIIHSGSTTQDLGALSAGSHTVTVVLGQFNHTACAVRGSATFTVAAPLPGSVGSGGYLDQSSSGSPIVTLVALASASLAVLCLGVGLRRRARRA